MERWRGSYCWTTNSFLHLTVVVTLTLAHPAPKTLLFCYFSIFSSFSFFFSSFLLILPSFCLCLVLKRLETSQRLLFLFQTDFLQLLLLLLYLFDSGLPEVQSVCCSAGSRSPWASGELLLLPEPQDFSVSLVELLLQLLQPFSSWICRFVWRCRFSCSVAAKNFSFSASHFANLSWHVGLFLLFMALWNKDEIMMSVGTAVVCGRL